MVQAQVTRLIAYGKEFFSVPASSSGMVDGKGKAIVYCRECSAEYDGVEIYHYVASATFKKA